MPICHKNRFIFIHIPRCAGTSIESYFRLQRLKNLYGVINSGEQSITLQHLTPLDLRQSGLVDDDTLQTYFKFTIIRDPFDRLASDYFWQQRHDVHQLFAGISFPEYLQIAAETIENGGYFDGMHMDHFRPMADYCISGETLLVDDILLLDDIENELKRIEGRIGRVEMPHENRSPNPYQHLRTQTNLDLVYEYYAMDKLLYEQVQSLSQTYATGTTDPELQGSELNL